MIDLPFAIPTLVTGVMLVVLYGPQSAVGGWLDRELGWRIIFAPPGIILALLFVTFPFVVRAVQPVLEALDLRPGGGGGHARRQRLDDLPARGAAGHRSAAHQPARCSASRAPIGEFGAIVIVAGNIPFARRPPPCTCLGEIESENRRGASAMSLVMLTIAFALVLLVDLLGRRTRSRGCMSAMLYRAIRA